MSTFQVKKTITYATGSEYGSFPEYIADHASYTDIQPAYSEITEQMYNTDHAALVVYLNNPIVVVGETPGVVSYSNVTSEDGSTITQTIVFINEEAYEDWQIYEIDYGLGTLNGIAVGFQARTSIRLTDHTLNGRILTDSLQQTTTEIPFGYYLWWKHSFLRTTEVVVEHTVIS